MGVMILFSVVTALVIIQSNARECPMNITMSVSQLRYERIHSAYSTSCGLLWLSRCTRTRYRIISVLIYQLQVVEMQRECCDGYTISGSTCIPVCEEDCVPPRYCAQPDECQCINDHYKGPSCDIPVCSNCSSPRVCLAPETCQCLPGYNGTNCSDDIDECEALDYQCEQLCVNTRGSYSCACQEGFILGDDGERCIGRVDMHLTTINSSALLAEWRHPEWDRENLTVAYNITCSNDKLGVNSSTLLNDTAPGQNVQLSLNLNTEGGYECCIIVITSNGNGLPSCINNLPEVTITEDPSAVKIGLGVAGAGFALFAFVVIVLVVGYFYKQKVGKVSPCNSTGLEKCDCAGEKPDNEPEDYIIPIEQNPLYDWIEDRLDGEQSEENVYDIPKDHCYGNLWKKPV